MIVSTIIKNYFILFLSITTGFVFIISLGLFFIFKKKNKIKASQEKNMIQNTTESKQQPITISSKDIHAIAGNDVVATQLDLARAYIETGRKQLAKKILQFTLEQGTSLQQEEANRLLNLL